MQNICFQMFTEAVTNLKTPKKHNVKLKTNVTFMLSMYLCKPDRHCYSAITLQVFVYLILLPF